MKRLFYSIFLVIYASLISAQNFYISFEPKAGNALIDSILVTNLKTNQKVKLAGSESLLLNTSATVVSSLQKSFETGYLYPNPSNGDATLVFSTISNEQVIASMHNVSGQLLDQIILNLSPGCHRLLIQFPAPGIYYLTIMKSDGVLGLKAVIKGKQKQESLIYCRESENLQARVEAYHLKSISFEKTMEYNTGEVLYYSAYSGKNITILTDIPVATKVYTIEFAECIDYEKQSFPVVKIGTQWWMAGNLSTTRYQDGTVIPDVPDNSSWANQTTGAYCWYNNSEATNKNRFGALYNWYAAGDSRKLCPAGWHVPGDTEWKTLENWLIANGYNYDKSTIGNNIGKSLAATTSWDPSAIKGAVGNTDYPAYRNKSGFTALPGGGRAANGAFDIAGSWGIWWSSTSYSSLDAWARYLGNTETSLDRFTDTKKTGYSVRCVRDNQ